VRLGTRRLRAELSALVALPRSRALPDDASRGGSFGFQAVELSGCWSPFDRGRAFACAGFEVGRISAAPFGIDHESRTGALWLAPAGSVLLQLVEAGSVRLELRAGLAVPVFRPSFEIDARGAVFQPSGAAGRLELGIGWR